MSKFSFATESGGFDNHIEKSIRGYNDLFTDILKFSSYFIEEDATVVDIGCSTGRLIRQMKDINDEFSPGCSYIGIEYEEVFFEKLENSDGVEFKNMAIQDFDWETETTNCCLVTSLFTLQFLPKRNRIDVVRRIHDSLVQGGAFIFSEKILSNSAEVEKMLTFCHYDWKLKNFTPDQILDKERTLRNIMKPGYYVDLVDMLTDSGFKIIQPFWQYFSFVGIIAVRS